MEQAPGGYPGARCRPHKTACRMSGSGKTQLCQRQCPGRGNDDACRDERGGSPSRSEIHDSPSAREHPGEDHEDESAQHAESAQSDPDKDARCAGIGGACQILVDGSPGVSRSNVRIEECARHEQ